MELREDILVVCLGAAHLTKGDNRMVSHFADLIISIMMSNDVPVRAAKAVCGVYRTLDGFEAPKPVLTITQRVDCLERLLSWMRDERENAEVQLAGAWLCVPCCTGYVVFLIHIHKGLVYRGHIFVAMVCLPYHLSNCAEVAH